MLAIDPAEFEIQTLSYDQFGRPDESYGRCNFGSDKWYIIAAAILDFGILLLSAYQSYKARNLSTEFAESKYIFRALLCILLVAFVGTPVLILAKSSPDSTTFVVAAMNFVICLSILLFIFVPKIAFARKAKRKSDRNVRVTGLTDTARRSDRKTTMVVPPSAIRYSTAINNNNTGGGDGDGNAMVQRSVFESDITLDDPERLDSMFSDQTSSSSVNGERIVTTESADKLARKVKTLEWLLRLAEQKEKVYEEELVALRQQLDETVLIPSSGPVESSHVDEPMDDVYDGSLAPSSPASHEAKNDDHHLGDETTDGTSSLDEHQIVESRRMETIRNDLPV